MIQIQDKNVENQVYFPKSTNIEGDLVLKLHSELTQKDYTFDVVNESKTSNYYKFNVNFKSVENGEYTYFINDTDSGLIRVGNVDEAVSTSTYIDGIEVVQYYPQDVKEIDYSKEPLTFNILSAGTINWTASNTGITKTIEYKLNDGKWISITSDTGETAPTINVVEGDKIQFRGNNESYGVSGADGCRFISTARFNVYGNIMSLINSTSFSGITSVGAFAFAILFSGNGVVSAENLILPATTLAESCYQNMFIGCDFLTVAPKLPATTLAYRCYRSMFYYCTSLKTAPELPATKLAIQCYSTMFNGCASLNYIKCLATDISATYCTDSWVGGVSSTGTFIKNPDMTSWTTGGDGIPTNWTIENNIE